MVVVLGIDPGTAHTGYGVVVSRGQRLAALDGGVIGTGPDERLERRLARIHARVCDLIAEHRPAAVAVEDLFFGQNARTAFAVGQARGAVLLSAGLAGVPCYSYTPAGGQAGGLRLGRRREGPGPADGRRAARAARARPADDHAADALAVAICHANGGSLAAPRSDDRLGSRRRSRSGGPTTW